MTQDEIIRMAREAGFVVKNVNGYLELKLCHPTPRAKNLGKMFERFAAIVRAEALEGSAKWLAESGSIGSNNCAEAIRARGEK